MSIPLVPFVEIQQQNIALLFCNYARSQGIQAEIQATSNGYTICCPEEALEQTKVLFEEFIQAPNDAKYQKAAWRDGEVTALDENQASLLSTFKENFLAHAGITTLSAFIACWLVYGLSVFGFAVELFDGLKFYSALTWSEIVTQPHRLITPALFHFSIIHIAFNTMWWWQLGGSIEKVQGSGHLLMIFFVSALVSNFSQFLVSGPNFGGLSGVVYAVVGYVWFMGYLLPKKGLFLSKPIIGMLLVWMMLGFIDLLPVNVANTAHLTGLLSGCGLALIVWFRSKKGSL